MRYLVFFVFLITSLRVKGQNRPILYDFADLPQSSLLNPALGNDFKFHSGIPLLSGISAEFGNSGFTIFDLFANDNRTFTQKVNDVISDLETRDFGVINSQIELVNAGIRLNKKTYLSFGFYHELDGIAYFPKDVFTLVNEGNSAYLNRVFSLSQVNFKFDAIGVLHFGLQVQVDDKLSVGGRIKLYSSAVNIQTRNNTGTFTTVRGANNIYRHFLNNVNFNVNTSGLYRDEEIIDEASEYLGNTLFGKNSGLGVDLGFSYEVSPQFQFSASILDFGVITYKDLIRNAEVNGSFTFEGVNFLFDPNNPTNYWGQISDAFKRDVPSTDNQNSYSSWRPTKINAAVKYSFGEKRSKICYDNRYEDFYTDAVGAHLFTVFRPLFPQVALTGFYQKSLTDKIHAKATYTIDDYSFANLGLGFSIQISKLNLYTTFDNILNYGNITRSNNIRFQIGANLIFN